MSEPSSKSGELLENNHLHYDELLSKELPAEGVGFPLIRNIALLALLVDALFLLCGPGILKL